MPAGRPCQRDVGTATQTAAATRFGAAVVFPTLQFGLFFPVVFVVAWLLRPFSTSWKVFLLVASYAFYAWWRFDVYHGRYCLLLIALTVGSQAFLPRSGSPAVGCGG